MGFRVRIQGWGLYGLGEGIWIEIICGLGWCGMEGWL